MNFGRNIFLWLIIGLLLAALFNIFQEPQSPTQAMRMPFSDFMKKVESGKVSEVVIRGRKIRGVLQGGERFRLYAPEDPSLVPTLRENNVSVSAMPEEEGMNTFWNILISWFPMLLLIAVWIFFMRQVNTGGRGAMGFGKSKAKMLTENKKRVTFADVAGIDEAKQEVEEVIDFLKDPHRFQRLGGEIPKGLLLVGPPGTGKTLLARAIAGEAGVPFFSISGSDFVEMFVGVGASRVRDMFEQGKKNAPCIIFMDELDAVGRHRGAGLGGGNDEREQTLNQLLVEMDGFEANEGIILVAATNRPDVLDPALLRPGRFDRQVTVPNPDIQGREKILNVHMRKVPLGPDVDPRVIARGTPGFSGADLQNLVNEAALLAARRNKRVVTMSDFEYAKDKVLMGTERKSLVMSDDEKRNTAYHESGHAICALNESESDPVHKATIIPRGRSLGMVMRLPEKDRFSTALAKLKADLTVAMGGRVAEELVFKGDAITTGAAQDIRMATDTARKMVTEWGLSEKMGPLTYGEPSQEVFLGHSVTENKTMSEDTARQVDEEVRRIVEEAHNRARRILSENQEKLEQLAQALLEYETLTGNEIRDLLAGKDISPGFVAPESEAPQRSSVPEAGRTEESGAPFPPGLKPKPQGT